MILNILFYISNCFTTAEILAEMNAEMLRKKKTLENQQIQENKLSLAQINGRLTELLDRRNELRQEKQALLSQTEITDIMSLAMQRTGLKWYLYFISNIFL